MRNAIKGNHLKYKLPLFYAWIFRFRAAYSGPYLKMWLKRKLVLLHADDLETNPPIEGK